MIGFRFLRTAALALELYGILGLAIAVAMLVVGVTTFAQIASLQKTLDDERTSLVQSIRTVSGTVRDTAGATSDFQKSINGAREAADTASGLANSTAGTFRGLANAMNASIFGAQPLASMSPQFAQSADQLQQLAISLGQTRDSLAQNSGDVTRVGSDLTQLQAQLDAVASSLNQPGVLALGSATLLPFEVAFFGMCVLVILQSAFSLVAGITLFRLQRALGTEALFPSLGAADAKRATTSDGAALRRVRPS